MAETLERSELRDVELGDEVWPLVLKYVASDGAVAFLPVNPNFFKDVDDPDAYALEMAHEAIGKLRAEKGDSRDG